jgi:hypothetical protein
MIRGEGGNTIGKFGLSMMMVSMLGSSTRERISCCVQEQCGISRHPICERGIDGRPLDPNHGDMTDIIRQETLDVWQEASIEGTIQARKSAETPVLSRDAPTLTWTSRVFNQGNNICSKQRSGFNHFIHIKQYLQRLNHITINQ